MKVITLCGSLRFKEEMMKVAMDLELQGNCVLTPVYPIGEDKDAFTEEEAHILDQMHRHRIDLSDMVYIVNKDGYIGNSVRKEIEYSKSENKKNITFSSDKLINEGDTAVLDYKVKNNSTQYGANVTISCNNYGNEYVEITGEFAGSSIPLDNPIEMEAQEIKNGYISAELVNAYPGEDDSISITCTIIANATSKDSITEYIPIPYKDEVLNGADPILKDELIPVTIEDDGTVTYANIEEKWYDYENKKWANAVILEDNASYNVGDIIKEDDIESYFVWIPRYRYQIFDEGNYTKTIERKPTESNAQEIQIEFEGKDVTPSNGSTKDSWLTHPAFTNFDVNGLWVGKFETGYKGANTKQDAQANEVDSSKVIIKSNTYSWRGSTVANMFKTAYNYNRDLDSHMMKNTEWGAVAYLSHSKYGINKEVNINNNSDYLTGYSAVEGTNQNSYPGTYGTNASVTLAYNTPTGYKASTTGNITGVYDMSGGSSKYMASYMAVGSSGFTTANIASYDSKYFDVYSSKSSIQEYNYRILGDATGEMGPFYKYDSRYHNSWYGDSSGFVESTNPWFIRGGWYGGGVLSGQFNFTRDTGGVSTDNGSRLVLAP